MASTEIRLIIFFAAKGREALYSQQKQDWELTVAQIMNSLLPNSDLNWKSRDFYFADKALSSQSYGFSSSHVRMWELDHK